MIARPLRHGVWWMLDYLYAARWQLRGLGSRANESDYLSGALVPVVIIPGIYENWQFMRPLIDALHAAGHPVHVVTSLRRNRQPVAHGAAVVADYLEQNDLRQAVIVAHSKGGLIGRELMVRLDGSRRVAGMVAVCVPFSGSRYARYMVVPSLRSFSAAHTALLARGTDATTNARIVSIFGEFDPHIPEGSELTGARNIHLKIGGHFRILGSRATIDAVIGAISDFADDGGTAHIGDFTD